LARTVALAWDLLLVRDDAGRAAEVHEERAALHALHDARDDLALLVAEFLEDGELLRLADLLDYHLLRGLRRDAAEVVLRLEREDDLLADLRGALDALRVLDEHVLLRVVAGELALRELYLVMAAVLRL